MKLPLAPAWLEDFCHNPKQLRHVMSLAITRTNCKWKSYRMLAVAGIVQKFSGLVQVDHLRAISHLRTKPILATANASGPHSEPRERDQTSKKVSQKVTFLGPKNGSVFGTCFWDPIPALQYVSY